MLVRRPRCSGVRLARAAAKRTEPVVGLVGYRSVRWRRSHGSGSFHSGHGTERMHRTRGSASLHTAHETERLHRTHETESLHRTLGAARLHKAHETESLQRAHETESLHRTLGAASFHRSHETERLHRADRAESLHTTHETARLPRTRGTCRKPRCRALAELAPLGPRTDSPARQTHRPAVARDAAPGPGSRNQGTLAAGPVRTSQLGRSRPLPDRPRRPTDLPAATTPTLRPLHARHRPGTTDTPLPRPLQGSPRRQRHRCRRRRVGRRSRRRP